MRQWGKTCERPLYLRENGYFSMRTTALMGFHWERAILRVKSNKDDAINRALWSVNAYPPSRLTAQWPSFFPKYYCQVHKKLVNRVRITQRTAQYQKPPDFANIVTHCVNAKVLNIEHDYVTQVLKTIVLDNTTQIHHNTQPQHPLRTWLLTNITT